MDIVERLRRWSAEESTHELLSDATDEIERLREALIFIGWASIQSVDDAAKYARNTLEGNDDGTVD